MYQELYIQNFDLDMQTTQMPMS